MRVQVFALLVVASVCSAQESPAPDSLTRLMPKDQLRIVEQAEEVQRLERQANIEQNGLKKKEIQQKGSDIMLAMHKEIDELAKSKGLVGWVAIYAGSNDHYFRSKPMGALRLQFLFKGMSDEVKNVVRELKPNDVVRFTSKPHPATTTTEEFFTGGRWLETIKLIKDK